MEIIGGYAGKILRINLSTGEITFLNTMDYVQQGFLGGKALGLKLQWDFGNPEVEDGFDPRSLLIFATGPFNGTGAPDGGRMVVLGKQVHQYKKNYFSHSNVGGWWAPELKFAGYDAIMLEGKADKPVYLHISDDQIELRDAARYWDTTAHECIERIRQKEYGGDEKVRIACIGPAGTNLTRIGAIMFDFSKAAAQNGFGGVMGSKNLKAIAVRGTGGIKVANPRGLLDERLKAMDILDHCAGRATIRGDFRRDVFDLKGGSSCFGCIETCTAFANPTDGPRGGSKCGFQYQYNATMVCHQGIAHFKKTPYGDTIMTDKDGKLIGGRLFSAMLGQLAQIHAKMYDLYGLASYDMLGDRGSASVFKQMWFDPIMEGKFYDWCVKEIGCEPGTATWAKEYPRKVAYREGKLGNLMAEGLPRFIHYVQEHPEEFGLNQQQGDFALEAYQRLYHNDRDCLDHYFYRPSNAAEAYGNWTNIMQCPMMQLIHGLGTMDEGHNHHSFDLASDDWPHGRTREYCMLLYGNPDAWARYLDEDGNTLVHNQWNSPDPEKWYTVDMVEKKPVKGNWTVGTAEALRLIHASNIIHESMSQCDYHSPMIAGGVHNMNFTKVAEWLGHPELKQTSWCIHNPEGCTDLGYECRIWNDLTGADVSVEEFYDMGWKAWLLEQAIHVRDNDRTIEDNQVNKFFLNRPDKNGITIDYDAYNEGLRRYYSYNGFDPKTGRPRREQLEEFGLGYVADALEAIGRLGE